MRFVVGEIVWTGDTMGVAPHLKVISPDPDPLPAPDVGDCAAGGTGLDRAFGASKPLGNLLD